MLTIAGVGQKKDFMKEEHFYGITMYVLPGKEVKKYISNNKGAFDSEFSKITRVSTYVFPTEMYLYDFSAYAFLFKTKDDLLKFRKKSLELADKELKARKLSSLNETFIKETDDLILDFERENNIKLDFNQLLDLKKLDSLINNSVNKQIFGNQWINNLIAIVGKFIIVSLQAHWAINKVNGIDLVLIVDDQMNSYNPIYIVDKEINEYLKENRAVCFYDHVEIELIQYKAFNALLK